MRALDDVTATTCASEIAEWLEWRSGRRPRERPLVGTTSGRGAVAGFALRAGFAVAATLICTSGRLLESARA